MATLIDLLPTVIGVAILLALATITLTAAGVPHRWAALLAVVRGALQLAVISIVLTGVIGNAWAVAAALGVMFVVAVVTCTRRIGWSVQRLACVAAAMATGISATLVIIFGSGAIEFSPRYVLALGGIIIGGAMATATLAGRRLAQATDDRWAEVEGWLAVGATPGQATADIARTGIREALIPSLDQTKTAGLVTLPGAFVGAIFGGIAPLEAGRFQVVVLAGIIAASAVSATLLARVLAPALYRSAPR